MTDTVWQAFNDRIAWEGDVHVACETLDAPLDTARRMRLDGLDAGILATLGILGEKSGAEPVEDEATGNALVRLEAKLDVLLEMFNRHLLGHIEMPPKYNIRLNAKGIRIDDWQPPAPDTAVLMRLYFDACMGLPLELSGRVAAAPASARFGFVAFDEPGQTIRDGIEHLVFRQHRRQVAEARRDAQPTRR